MPAGPDRTRAAGRWSPGPGTRVDHALGLAPDRLVVTGEHLGQRTLRYDGRPSGGPLPHPFPFSPPLFSLSFFFFFFFFAERNNSPVVDFALTDENRLVQQSVGAFAEAEILPYIREWDEKGEVHREVFRADG